MKSIVPARYGNMYQREIMPVEQRQFRKHIIVCNPDYYLYHEMQLGLAGFRNDHSSWSFIVDQCLPNHCYNGRQADGAVVSMMSRQILESWKSFSGKLVNVSHSMESYPFPSVFSDDLVVGDLAADHFLDRNFEHFAFFGALAYAHSRERLKGFEEGLTERSDKPLHVDVYEPPKGQDFFRDLFSRRLLDWLDSLPRPVGVFVYDDLLAAHLIEFLNNNGIQVPDDIAVLGVNDDARLCMMARVPLSSVSLDGYLMGYRAGDCLHRLLNGDPVTAVERIPPRLVTARQSTDMVANLNVVLRKGIIFIRHHLSEAITVDDVSRHAGCSRRVLERHFREHFGHGPYEEILRSRINRAKQYLGNSPKTVEEISTMCGFSEPNLFYTQFRKRVGTSPREWRRNARKVEARVHR